MAATILATFAGVVADYYDLANNWRRSRPFTPSQREQGSLPAGRQARRPGRQTLTDTYGTFEQNPNFWKSIAPIHFVNNISGPVQIHHGTADEEVPLLFSERLDEALQKANKKVELYTYDGDDHNISASFNVAMQRSVAFMDSYLK